MEVLLFRAASRECAIAGVNSSQQARAEAKEKVLLARVGRGLMSSIHRLVPPMCGQLEFALLDPTEVELC